MGLVVRDASLELYGKSHKFCQTIGQMVGDRLNRQLPVEDADGSAVVMGWFRRILRNAYISGKTWDDTEEIVCAMCTRYHEMLGGAPADLRFLIHESTGDIGLEMRDARAVDRADQCREAVTLLLHPRVIRYAYIRKDIRLMLARMVWATRWTSKWELWDDTGSAHRKTKGGGESSPKKTRSSYWEGSEADDHAGSEESSGGSDSFSEPDEESSSEDESFTD